MTEFEIYYTARRRLEALWREAERRGRIQSELNSLGEDPETNLSRAAGGRV